MPVPSVKGYMPLCYTQRSHVCDEQGIGQWPMWQRFDSVKAIVDQYIDEPYRSFLALPYHEVDKLKGEEIFYWYTPKSNATYTRMNKTGDDHDTYKRLLADTLAHYRDTVERLKREDKLEEADFLQTSLKYAGDSEDNIYCGDGRVVATVWGMRPRPGFENQTSVLIAELDPEKEMHKVEYDLGSHGDTKDSTSLNKSHGSVIYKHQVPQVTPSKGYEFTGWDKEPLGAVVDDNLTFTAQYKELPKPMDPIVNPPTQEVPPKQEDPPQQETPQMHHVRFLTPTGQVIKELDVEHGKTILPGEIPQLPTVNNVFCKGWDGDPLNDILNNDRDYKAIPPDTPLHTVRFLTPNGEVQTQFQVPDGTKLTAEQVPSLPVVDGNTSPGWDSDPLKATITKDMDFVAKAPKKGWLSALLRWLLLLLGLLLIFLLLWCFIFGRCHINLCGECNCKDTAPVVIPLDRKTKPNPVVTDPENLPEPTKDCGVHFSGWYLSDKDEYPWRDCSKIFEEEEFGEYVGNGDYPDNTKILPKSMNHSFDAVAVRKGTRLIIYSEPNFKGREVLNVKGPILIENVIAKDDYGELMTYTFSGELQELFPPERRQWSSENMHDWAYGSCKIICEECGEK